MKKINILLIIFSFVFQITKAQTSLDSLRLSAPLKLNNIPTGIEISFTNSMVALFNDNSKTCNILDPKTGVVLQKIINEKGIINQVYFSKDDTYLAIFSNSGISFWEIRTGNFLKHIDINTFSNFFKISGRYFINNNFDYTKFNNNYNIFKKNTDVSNRDYYYTSFYKLNNTIIPYFFNKLIDTFNNKHRYINEDYEVFVPNILKNNIAYYDTLGITQIFAPFFKIDEIQHNKYTMIILTIIN